jgi:hypothetical protein
MYILQVTNTILLYTYIYYYLPASDFLVCALASAGGTKCVKLDERTNKTSRLLLFSSLTSRHGAIGKMINFIQFLVVHDQASPHFQEDASPNLFFSFFFLSRTIQQVAINQMQQVAINQMIPPVNRTWHLVMQQGSKCA